MGTSVADGASSGEVLSAALSAGAELEETGRAVHAYALYHGLLAHGTTRGCVLSPPQRGALLVRQVECALRLRSERLVLAGAEELERLVRRYALSTSLVLRTTALRLRCHAFVHPAATGARLALADSAVLEAEALWSPEHAAYFRSVRAVTAARHHPAGPQRNASVCALLNPRERALHEAAAAADAVGGGGGGGGGRGGDGGSDEESSASDAAGGGGGAVSSEEEDEEAADVIDPDTSRAVSQVLWRAVPRGVRRRLSPPEQQTPPPPPAKRRRRGGGGREYAAGDAAEVRVDDEEGGCWVPCRVVESTGDGDGTVRVIVDGSGEALRAAAAELRKAAAGGAAQWEAEGFPGTTAAAAGLATLSRAASLSAARGRAMAERAAAEVAGEAAATEAARASEVGLRIVSAAAAVRALDPSAACRSLAAAIGVATEKGFAWAYPALHLAAYPPLVLAGRREAAAWHLEAAESAALRPWRTSFSDACAAMYRVCAAPLDAGGPSVSEAWARFKARASRGRWDVHHPDVHGWAAGVAAAHGVDEAAAAEAAEVSAGRGGAGPAAAAAAAAAAHAAYLGSLAGEDEGIAEEAARAAATAAAAPGVRDGLLLGDLQRRFPMLVEAAAATGEDGGVVAARAAIPTRAVLDEPWFKDVAEWLPGAAAYRLPAAVR